MRADAEPSCTVNARSKLAISYVPIESPKAEPRNPRVHNKRQVRQIAKSIEAFGFNVHILIEAGNNVIAGHGRLLAGQLLGRRSGEPHRQSEIHIKAAIVPVNRGFFLRPIRLVLEWNAAAAGIGGPA